MHTLESLFLPPPIATYSMDKTGIDVSLMEDRNKFFVYLLILNGEIVYIGRTTNLYSRMNSHKHKKDFTKVIMFEYNSYKEICKVETTLIKIYKPFYNINCVNAA
jgi:excinuclease UvrABC nuclease subunit